MARVQPKASIFDRAKKLAQDVDQAMMNRMPEDFQRMHGVKPKPVLKPVKKGRKNGASLPQ